MKNYLVQVDENGMTSIADLGKFESFDVSDDVLYKHVMPLEDALDIISSEFADTRNGMIDERNLLSVISKEMVTPYTEKGVDYRAIVKESGTPKNPIDFILTKAGREQFLKSSTIKSDEKGAFAHAPTTSLHDVLRRR